MNLQQLLAKKAQLKAKLEQIQSAIDSFGDQTPVKVTMQRNLRNTPGVTWEWDDDDELLVIFDDPEFTQPASKNTHVGWVNKTDWELFKTENPDLIDDLIWETS